MDKDLRRLLEDIGIAKTAYDTSKIKSQLEDFQRQAEDERYRREQEEEEKQDAKKGKKFFNLGEENFFKKEWENALDNFQVAARSYPDDYYFEENGIYCKMLSLYRISQCYERLGELRKSFIILENIMKDKGSIAIDDDYLRLFIGNYGHEIKGIYKKRLNELESISEKDCNSEKAEKEVNIIKYRLFQNDYNNYYEYKNVHDEVDNNFHKIANLKKELEIIEREISHKGDDRFILIFFGGLVSVGSLIVGLLITEIFFEKGIYYLLFLIPLIICLSLLISIRVKIDTLEQKMRSINDQIRNIENEYNIDINGVSG